MLTDTIVITMNKAKSLIKQSYLGYLWMKTLAAKFFFHENFYSKFINSEIKFSFISVNLFQIIIHILDDITIEKESRFIFFYRSLSSKRSQLIKSILFSNFHNYSICPFIRFLRLVKILLQNVVYHPSTYQQYAKRMHRWANEKYTFYLLFSSIKHSIRERTKNGDVTVRWPFLIKKGKNSNTLLFNKIESHIWRKIFPLLKEILIK